MDVLIARGRAALAAYIGKAYAPADRPFAIEHLTVVTREDFLVHIALCLDYADANRSLYVLGPTGAIVALLCRHPMIPRG